jgi:CRISPR type I-E-associated protein CasB/Cse2
VAAETDKPIDAVNAVLGWQRRWLQLDAGDSRAARARLRRAASAFDALLLAETQVLIRAVHVTRDKRLPRDADERLAVLAMTLAHVERSSPTPFAAALGFGPHGGPPNLQQGERPRLSPARFGALTRAVHSRDWDRFARASRRAVAILGDSAFNVPRFVRDVLSMNDRTLQRWIYQYWQTDAPPELAGKPAPNPSSNETESIP